MASLRTAPIPFPSPGGAEPWMQLNRELSAFFDELEAHSDAAAGWFTPERAAQLAILLQRGQDLLAGKHWSHPEVARQKAVYGAHLRLLLAALQALDGELSAAAERLQTRHRHMTAARSWAVSQSSERAARPLFSGRPPDGRAATELRSPTADDRSAQGISKQPR